MSKNSELTFIEGFTSSRSNNKNPQKAFDWDKAAKIIKEILKKHPNLVAEAGLQSDWAHTGDVIFEDGKPSNEGYTYLSSNWANPTLIIEVDGEEILELECFIEDGRFSCDSKWDDGSLNILGLKL